MERLTVRIGGNVYYSNNGNPLLAVEIKETSKVREILTKLAMYEDKYEGRDTPKKPKEHYNWCDFSEQERKENSQWFCPSCNREIGEEHLYCNECGQKIDWN